MTNERGINSIRLAQTRSGINFLILAHRKYRGFLPQCLVVMLPSIWKNKSFSYWTFSRVTGHSIWGIFESRMLNLSQFKWLVAPLKVHYDKLLFFFLNQRWYQKKSLCQKELKIKKLIWKLILILWKILKISDFQKNTVHNKNIIVILIFRFLIKYD